MPNITKIPKKIIEFFQGKKDLRVGLALGSGNYFGWAHLGVLSVLEENKIPIDYIAGSSIGAIIGACYALNPSLKEYQNAISSLTKWNLIKLIDIRRPVVSLISGNKIKILLEKIIGDKSFSDTKIPLKIIATDLESGEEVILEEGKLIDAIMPSISIPCIFPPIRLKEKLLVDGGLINATPINVVKNMGAEVIIGVDLTITDKVEIKKPNIFQILMRSYEILRSQPVKYALQEDTKNLIIIKPDTNKLKELKFYEIEKFKIEGEKATREALPKIKATLQIS